MIRCQKLELNLHFVFRIKFNERNCSKQSAITHETIHVLRFFHKHTRISRDEYIKVLSENIKQGEERKFVIESAPYDKIYAP